MTDKQNATSEKIKVSVQKNWKKLAIGGTALLLIGAAGIGGYKYYDHQQEVKEEKAHLTKALTQSGALAKTYSQWHQVVTKSDLSSSDKATFIKTLEANKSDIEKLAADKEKAQTAYQSILGTFESDYSKLATTHESIWKKLDSSFTGFAPLSEVSSEKIDSLKQDISASSLSDADKKTLTADADKMLELSKKWNTAYPKYSTEALAAKKAIEKDSKTVLNELVSDKITIEELGKTVGIERHHFGGHEEHGEHEHHGDHDKHEGQKKDKKD